MKTMIFASVTINREMLAMLQDIGNTILVPELEKTYKSINTHPDIQMSVVNNRLFIDEDSWKNLLTVQSNTKYLKDLSPIILKTQLGNRYPLSVPFNGKYLENTWIHHLEYTDISILNYIKEKSIKCIHTNQGYSGCALLLLPNRKGITSDPGLSKTLIELGYDILLIREGHIILDELSHGFIGGCCGFYNNILYVHGDLSLHPDSHKIYEFLQDQPIKIKEIRGYPLTDIGSILFYEGGNNE